MFNISIHSSGIDSDVTNESSAQQMQDELRAFQEQHPEQDFAEVTGRRTSTQYTHVQLSR